MNANKINKWLATILGEAGVGLALGFREDKFILYKQSNEPGVFTEYFGEGDSIESCILDYQNRDQES